MTESVNNIAIENKASVQEALSLAAIAREKSQAAKSSAVACVASGPPEALPFLAPDFNVALSDSMYGAAATLPAAQVSDNGYKPEQGVQESRTACRLHPPEEFSGAASRTAKELRTGPQPNRRASASKQEDGKARRERNDAMRRHKSVRELKTHSLDSLPKGSRSSRHPHERKYTTDGSEKDIHVDSSQHRSKEGGVSKETRRLESRRRLAEKNKGRSDRRSKSQEIEVESPALPRHSARRNRRTTDAQKVASLRRTNTQDHPEAAQQQSETSVPRNRSTTSAKRLSETKGGNTISRASRTGTRRSTTRNVGVCQIQQALAADLSSPDSEEEEEEYGEKDTQEPHEDSNGTVSTAEEDSNNNSNSNNLPEREVPASVSARPSIFASLPRPGSNAADKNNITGPAGILGIMNSINRNGTHNDDAAPGGIPSFFGKMAAPQFPKFVSAPAEDATGEQRPSLFGKLSAPQLPKFAAATNNGFEEDGSGEQRTSLFGKLTAPQLPKVAATAHNGSEEDAIGEQRPSLFGKLAVPHLTKFAATPVAAPGQSQEDVTGEQRSSFFGKLHAPVFPTLNTPQKPNGLFGGHQRGPDESEDLNADISEGDEETQAMIQAENRDPSASSQAEEEGGEDATDEPSEEATEDLITTAQPSLPKIRPRQRRVSTRRQTGSKAPSSHRMGSRAKIQPASDDKGKAPTPEELGYE